MLSILFFLHIILIINCKEEKDIFEEFKNLRFCGSDKVKHEIKYFSKSSKISKRNSTRHLATNYRPIRVYLETTYFEYQASQDSFLKDKVSLLKEALLKAVNGIKGLLEVEDIEDQNLFSNAVSAFSNYGIEKWSPIFDSGGDIKSDFLIAVKFDNQYELTNGALASAFPIILDDTTHRPTAGVLIVGKDTSFYSYQKVTEYFSEVFLHELTHALGFLDTMFHFYPLGYTGTIGTIDIRGKTRSMIMTPKVVEHAKKYFNCSTITGVELEDQEGEDIFPSHWDQRILLGDYMGAVIYQEEMTISEFTLAALEDSGWYKVNYYTGGLMRFGKNKGCNFLNKNCLDSEYKTEFENEFFNYENNFSPSCSAGRLSRTYSILNQYQSVVDKTYNSNFKFENNIYYSGAIYTTDYCYTHGQYNIEYKNSYFTGNCKDGNGQFGQQINYYNQDTKKSEMNHPNSDLPKELGEVYSDTSFCIMSSLVPTGEYKLYNSILHPMCYKAHCSSSFLTVQINDDYIVCPRQGGNVKAKGYDGLIHCPDYNLICTGTVVCNNMFDCIYKKSKAKEETYYYDYTSLTTQNFKKLPNVQVLSAYELTNDGVCPIYCSQCSKNKICRICMEGYNLVEIKKDENYPVICDNTINLEKLYFKGDDGTYYLCNEGCETCEGRRDNCLTCLENYYFLENSTNCYNKTNYPDGYYFNQDKKIFSACHQNCATCSSGPISDEKMNCDTCKPDLVYDEDEKNCNIKSNALLIALIVLIVVLLIAGIAIGVFISCRKKKAVDSTEIEMQSKM